MVISYVALLVIINFVQEASFASMNNCRLLNGDVLLYHRRVKQETTKHLSLQLVSYPEILLDKPGLTVINCISCIDMNLRKKESEESECKIVGGGIGYSFVKFAISSGRHYGFDYDIKIYGRKNLHRRKTLFNP